MESFKEKSMNLTGIFNNLAKDSIEESLPWIINEENNDFKDIDTGGSLSTFHINETIPDPLYCNHYTQYTREYNILIHKIWRLSPLYKQNVKGLIMLCWIGYNIETQELLIIEGYVNGKVKTTKSKIHFKKSHLSIHE